jgi:uncharacterized protein (DUF2336 family)
MATRAALVSALEDVAERGSPERRAEMLRRLTSLFVEGASALSDEHVQLFDDIFNRLIAEIEAIARHELSIRLAGISNAPPQVVRRLAQDDNISIAGPVLQHSDRLEATDLLDVARSKSQGHLLAIANRKQIAETVTDTLVRRGDREVVRNVAGNPGARLSTTGFSTLVQKAEKDGVLAAKVGQRADIPAPLFRELLSKATRVVQWRMFATAKPEIQAEIRRVLAEISSEISSDAASRDYTDAWQAVLEIQDEGKLDERALATLAGEGRYEETVAALSLLCKLPIEIVNWLMTDERANSILVVCKALGFAWPTARAIILLGIVGRVSEDKLEVTHRKFDRLSASIAQRILHFWQARGLEHKTNLSRICATDRPI